MGAHQSLTINNSTVIWQRSGSSPEVWRTALDVATNGIDWIHLGHGTRVAGGWQWTGQAFPANSTLRAQGFTTGGYFCGSGGVVESSLGAPGVVTHPVNQTLAVGGNAFFSVGVTGSEPMTFQWQKDGMDIAGATASTFTLSNVQTNDAGLYSIVVNNALGVVTSSNATLTVRLVNPPPDMFNPSANSHVYSLAVQADGKIIAGGGFTNLGGQSRSCIGRLNADGSLDASFNPGASGWVYSLAVQADGKILVGGEFTTLGGQSRGYIGRLNVDGSLDTSFNPGANSSVYSLTVQADGKILVGGTFTTLGGRSRSRIGRLNADGSLDASFNPSASGYVSSLALQVDGKILIGGNFSTLGGQSRGFLGRLNMDGSLDTSFNLGANGTVFPLAVQANGKILVGGTFTTMGGQSRSRIGRLNADGSLDTGFNPGASGWVYSLVVQADGKILVGGEFTTLGGQGRSRIGRLNADGSLDTSFNTDVSSYVYSLAVQADGKVLVGGAFTMLGGQSRSRIGRLMATEPAIQKLAFDGSTIIWQRSGSGPEVWRTLLDVATNGMDWIRLGDGARISDGWQWTGQAFPTNATLRARGFVAGSYFNGSAWYIESAAGRPFITSHPSSQMGLAGRTVSLVTTTVGSSPLAFQWRKSAAMIADATNSTLCLNNVSANDAADYDVVITNNYGAVTSSFATVTVYVPARPIITQDPQSQTVSAGRNVTFAVAANGEVSLSYQWFKNGTNLPGDMSSTLCLSGVNRRHAGVYSVVVSNPGGDAVSSNAVLRVLSPQRLGIPTLAASGSFTLTSTDADGTPLSDTDLAAFEAMASTNLIDWVPLTNTLSVTNGTLLLRDAERSNHPTRYYRLQEH